MGKNSRKFFNTLGGIGQVGAAVLGPIIDEQEKARERKRGDWIFNRQQELAGQENEKHDEFLRNIEQQKQAEELLQGGGLETARIQSQNIPMYGPTGKPTWGADATGMIGSQQALDDAHRRVYGSPLPQPYRPETGTEAIDRKLRQSQIEVNLANAKRLLKPESPTNTRPSDTVYTIEKLESLQKIPEGKRTTDQKRWIATYEQLLGYKSGDRQLTERQLLDISTETTNDIIETFSMGGGNEDMRDAYNADPKGFTNQMIKEYVTFFSGLNNERVAQEDVQNHIDYLSKKSPEELTPSFWEAYQKEYPESNIEEMKKRLAGF